MKNKFMLVALIGILLGVGMVLVSCGGSCPGDSAKCADNLVVCASTSNSTKKAQKAVDCASDRVKAVTAGQKYECSC